MSIIYEARTMVTKEFRRKAHRYFSLFDGYTDHQALGFLRLYDKACTGDLESATHIQQCLYEYFIHTIDQKQKDKTKEEIIALGKAVAPHGMGRIVIMAAEMMRRRGDLDDALSTCVTALKTLPDHQYQHSLETLKNTIQSELVSYHRPYHSNPTAVLS